MGADLSADGRLRYRLWRDLGEIGTAGHMVFVMLNPSTGDAEADDHTIRCCVRFARREGCARMSIVNLVPYRATQPADLLTWLKQTDPAELDDIEASNLMAMLSTAATATHLVAAWGSLAMMIGDRFARHGLAVAEATGKPLLCLGTTATGAPRHPSRLPVDAELVPWGHR